MTEAPGPFSEASEFYLHGRPPYSDELAEVLRRQAGLDGRGRLLDVGCGPGVLTTTLAPDFTAVIGLDPEPGMLAVGQQRARAANLEHVSFIRGRAEDIADLGIDPCRLVTFGQSFHWTSGVPVLNAVFDLLEPGGSLALVGHAVQDRPEPEGPGYPRIPEGAIREMVTRYSHQDPALAAAKPRATPHLHVPDVERSHFGGCRVVYAPGRPDVVRDVDSVVAGYYSTSFAAPSRFGDRRPQFEAEVRALLFSHSPEGLFWDWPGDTEIVLAHRQSAPGTHR